MKKIIKLGLMVFFLATMIVSAFTVMPGVAVTNNLASQMQLSVPITSFTAYDSIFKTNDVLVSGKTINVSPIAGQTLLQGDTATSAGTFIKLASTTFESDNIALGSTGVNLYDRAAYSPTFLNETFNAAVESNSTATTTTSMAISNKGTTGSFVVANDAVAASNNAYQQSVFAFDANNDGDYADATDKAASIPLGGSENFYVGVSSTFSASPNAADYGLLTLAFTRTTGTDYLVNVKMWATTGTNAWTGVGSTADNQATFNVYASSGAFVGLQIPIGTLFTQDSSELGGIDGLHYTQVKGLVAGASDSVTMALTNIAAFNDRIAFTDNTDNNNNYNFDGSSNLPTGLFDTDSDIIGSSITASAVDSSMPLIGDMSGSITTIASVRKIVFTGIMSIQPTSASSSSSEAVTGTNYYLTTENVYFDTRAIADFSTFSNMFVIGNVQVNVTIDDSVLEFTTHYQDNLYHPDGDYKTAFVVNDINKGDTFETAWAASGVSGSTSPKSQVQYDITDFSATVYSLDHLVLKIYTKTSYNLQLTTSQVAGGGVVIASTGSTNNMNFYIIVGIICAGIVGVLVLRSKNMKMHKNRRGRH